MPPYITLSRSKINKLSETDIQEIQHLEEFKLETSAKRLIAYVVKVKGHDLPVWIPSSYLQQIAPKKIIQYLSSLAHIVTSEDIEKRIQKIQSSEEKSKKTKKASEVHEEDKRSENEINPQIDSITGVNVLVGDTVIYGVRLKGSDRIRNFDTYFMIDNYPQETIDYLMGELASLVPEAEGPLKEQLTKKYLKS